MFDGLIYFDTRIGNYISRIHIQRHVWSVNFYFIIICASYFTTYYWKYLLKLMALLILNYRIIKILQSSSVIL